MARFLLGLLAIGSYWRFIDALIHHLTIHNDDRNVFKIETFGFVDGGKIIINLSDFSLHSVGKHHINSTTVGPKFKNPSANSSIAIPPTTLSKNASTVVPEYQIGFLMRHAESESQAQQDLEIIVERGQCIFDKKKPQDVHLDLSNPSAWKKVVLDYTIPNDGIGMYSLIFSRCHPTGQHLVSFKLDAEFINPGPNYLSAGDAPLPTMYLCFFVAFSIALGVWIWVLRRDPTRNGTVHRIHYMMAILLAFKVLSLFFESLRYHYIAIYGVSETWSIVYYVFACLKGIMLFTVILLIGSGYSLVKNYLHENEKRIILVVLILQVLDNVAMVILEETAPGSQGWLTWRDILHLVDILCCLAILLPIVWSIRHLRQAAEVDGKAQHNLVKLQLFRRFYIMVVLYIYFTRIAVYLLAATIRFYWLWLGPLATETATLLFFVITGYQFQPAVDNPYLPVATEDTEGKEYGLGEGDEEAGDVQLFAWKKPTAGSSTAAAASFT